MGREVFDMEQIILFGDSIFQQSFSQDRGFAFAAQLANTYIRRLDIVNRGFSGYNTRQALQVLPHTIPPRSKAKVRLLVIWYGANDSRLPDTPGDPQQHIPLNEYTQNLRAMLAHPDVRGQEGMRIVLITPPPVDERSGLENDQKGNPNNGDVIRRKARVTKQYAEAVLEVGKETGTVTLDLWARMIERAGGGVVDPEPTGSIDMPLNEDLRKYLYDGLHLSPEGYRVLYEEFMELLKREWPDMDADKMPFVMPRWDDVGKWQGRETL